MLGINASITPEGLLGDIADRVNDRAGVMSVLGGLLEDYEKNVFATSGLGRWAGDDPVTAQLKGSSRVLVDSGLLQRELTKARIEGDTVEVATRDAFYGRFLRDGDRGMPKRDPAPKPDSATVAGWADELVGFLITGEKP